MTPNPPHFAAFCEIVDAGVKATTKDAMASPNAAVVEFAQLLTAHETAIDDETRARIVRIAGALHRLGQLIHSDNIAGELRRDG